MMTAVPEVRDRQVKVNGVQLHYRAWGTPEAPPLLILHGLTGHAWEFDSVAAGLADRFYVLAVNQRGHGASAWAEAYSPEVMAEDAAAFTSALGLGRVRIIGHSMGGVNGWWFGARYPEKLEQLVILDIDPEVIAAERIVDWWTRALAAYDAARYASSEDAVAAYLSGYGGQHRQELRAFALNNLEQNADGRWTWRFDARRLIRWMEQAAADEAAHWALLRKLACPTLVIRAGDSSFTSTPAAERMVREIPQARLVEIAGAGHDLHIDRFDALMNELRDFLRAS